MYDDKLDATMDADLSHSACHIQFAVQVIIQSKLESACKTQQFFGYIMRRHWTMADGRQRYPI